MQRTDKFSELIKTSWQKCPA